MKSEELSQQASSSSELVNPTKQDLWHVMTLEEKRRAAHSLGMKISEWEDMQNLTSALAESENAPGSTILNKRQGTFSVALKRGGAEEMKQAEANVYESESEEEMAMIAPIFDDYDEEGYDSEDVSVDSDEDEALTNGGIVAGLPATVQHHICEFLECDSVGVAAIVSPHWHHMRDELVFKALCNKIYMVQGKKKQMNPRKWKGWRNMLIWRPRVRTNGFYMLKKAHIKSPKLDMWTEVQRGDILETVYYRYFLFDTPGPGQLTYFLTHQGPDEAASFLCPDSPKAAIGRYALHKGTVRAEVPAGHATIWFDLEVRHGWGGGHFAKLVLKGHRSSPAKLGPNSWQTVHKTNDECFYFFRDWHY